MITAQSFKFINIEDAHYNYRVLDHLFRADNFSKLQYWHIAILSRILKNHIACAIISIIAMASLISFGQVGLLITLMNPKPILIISTNAVYK